MSNIFFFQKFPKSRFRNLWHFLHKILQKIHEKYNFAFKEIPLQENLDKCPSFLMKQTETKSMQNFLRNINFNDEKYEKKVSEIFSVNCELIKILLIQGMK